MKRLQTRAAAAALSALLLALPTCALAAETAPLTLSTQQNAAPVERRTDLGQLSAFGRSHTYMGVSVSDEWLYQARIGGLPLVLSLFTPEGDGVTFREHLCAGADRRQGYPPVSARRQSAGWAAASARSARRRHA